MCECVEGGHLDDVLHERRTPERRRIKDQTLGLKIKDQFREIKDQRSESSRSLSPVRSGPQEIVQLILLCQLKVFEELRNGHDWLGD